MPFRLPLQGRSTASDARSITIAGAAVEPYPTAVLAGDNPETVVLDLMQPQPAGGRFWSLGGEARRDESGREGTRQHDVSIK